MSRVMKEDSSNIQVAIRVRPLIEREIRGGEASVIRVEDNLLVSSLLWLDSVRS